MQLRRATEADVPSLAALLAGAEDQFTTVAAMRLFALDSFDDVIEVNRVMMESTGAWQAAVIAEDPEPVGFVAIGAAFLAMTPEVIALSQRLYGDDFMSILGPRVEALGRVQSEYPADCLRISEVHVAPNLRSRGVGKSLLQVAIDQATESGLNRLGLQTLVGNPARRAFEAWGFELAGTKTDDEFQTYAGAPGYHLMIR